MATWTELPGKVRVYIGAIVLLAIPIAVIAIRDVSTGDYPHSEQHSYYWLILTAITLVTVPVFIFLPSVSTTVGIGDAFVICISMMFGPSPAVVANILYITFQSILLRHKHNIIMHRAVFNVSSAVLNVWLYSRVYQLLNPSGSPQLEDMIVPTFGLALSFFVSNSCMVATAIGLSTGTNILDFWYQNYRFLFLDFLVSASAGAFITLFSEFNLVAPILVAPFVGAVWGINKINKAKTIEAEQHLKEQEQLYLRTVESLALAVDAKDQTTYGHIRRVRAYAMGLARHSGITDLNELMAIETGSLLHDIGKLAIDDYILNKPGRLSKQEFE